MPADPPEYRPSAKLSARPGWVVMLVTGFLLPPLAFLASMMGMVLLLAGLIGRAVRQAGRRLLSAFS
jgi:hypothetical protein